MTIMINSKRKQIRSRSNWP